MQKYYFITFIVARLFISDMTYQTNLLDIPNEVLRDHILAYLCEQDIFWNVGFVCQRLMNVCFDICKMIDISSLYLAFHDKKGATKKLMSVIYTERYRNNKESAICGKLLKMNNLYCNTTKKDGISVRIYISLLV